MNPQLDKLDVSREQPTVRLELNIQELNTVMELIDSIMPVKEERDLLLQIMCTALDGKCLEKFVIFNGGGGNGKGVIDDLLLLYYVQRLKKFI